MTIALPTTDLAAWVGAEYLDGQCWDPFVRDAFKKLLGVDLPESYYEALPLLETAHDVRRSVPFTPRPWDLVMIRTHAFLLLHVGIALDGERFIQPWSDVGLVICRFADEQWSSRVAGFLRYRGKPTA